MSLPTPKFAEGDTVYLPRLDREDRRIPCPDCNDTGEWPITSPAGVEFTIGCPRCKGTVVMSELPPLRYIEWVPGVSAYVIDGVSLNSKPDDWKPAVEYSSGSQRLDEDKVFATHDEAMAAVEARAAAQNTEHNQQPEVMQARSFGALSLKDADIDQTWRSRWNAWYAFHDLKESIDAALEDRSEYNAKQRLDDLASDIAWRLSDQNTPEIGKAIAGLRNLSTITPEIEAHLSVLEHPLHRARENSDAA